MVTHIVPEVFFYVTRSQPPEELHLGLGIPFIIIAAGFGWASRTVKYLRNHIRAVNLLGGCILIATGIAMLTGMWSLIMTILQGVVANTPVVL